MNAIVLDPRQRPATLAGGWREIRRLLEARYVAAMMVVLAIAATNAFVGLGGSLVRDCDEARYGVAASEMLTQGSALVTTYAGATEYWNLKPPLGYWLIGAAYRLFGENAFALRLPSALAALAVVALTMWLARRYGGRMTALLAGAILASSIGFQYYHGARSGELDMPLTLLMLVLLALGERLAYSREARFGAGLVLALAFLLKSFAIVPFVGAIGLYLVWTRGWRSLALWRLPGAMLAITALVWAAARTAAEGSAEFVRRMFVEDLYLRATTTIDAGQHNGALDYVWALLDRFAPWPLFVLAALLVAPRFLVTGRSRDTTVLLTCFIVVPLIAFSAAQTHHSWYILPTYPAWSIVAAASIERLQLVAGGERAGLVLALAVVGLLAGEGRLLQKLSASRQPASQAFLLSLPERTGQRGAMLGTSFIPTYSERFLLQVAAGYHVREASSLAADGVDPRVRERWLLARDDAASAAQAEQSGLVAAARGPGFVLYERSATFGGTVGGQ